MSPNLLLSEATPGHALRHRLLAIAGTLVLIGTYLTLVITQPVELAEGLGQGVALATFAAYLLATFAAYLLAAVLLLTAALPQIPVSTLTLIQVALALNILLGPFVGSVLLPLCLDSIGTVLIGCLAGRRAGAATGVLGTLIWSLFAPTVLPFAAGAALVGFLAGTAARCGALRRVYLAPVVGALAGVVAGVVSAPVATFVYGGTSGVGTGAVVAAFRAMGDSLFSAVTKEALLSDPGDKAIAFLIAALLVYALSKRLSGSFDFVRRYRVLGCRTESR